MVFRHADTIVAIATPHGKGGIGVVRLSGSDLEPFAIALLGTLPKARFATYSKCFDSDGEILDMGIALYFPAPNSYTGEDVLEFQGHGGVALQHLILKRCIEIGARLAEPGEFTRRSFLNDKLDLAQAESVADLIDASTSEAARSAMRSLQGDFSKIIQDMVEKLIHLRMLVEAMLDFPEEQIDIDDISKRNNSLDDIHGQILKTIQVAKQGNLLRTGAYVVIAGQPNAGKSSLLNRLAGEELALVSDIPGTTRDIIRQSIQVNGVPLHILDTAGLRNAHDELEKMGIERTYQTLHQADLILLVIDANKGITTEDKEILCSLPGGIPRMLVFNKADLLKDAANTTSDIDSVAAVLVSAKSGSGMDRLHDKLLEAIGWHSPESCTFMARERHIAALTIAQKHLKNASSVIQQSEFFAEELSLAQRALSEITGEFTPDDLLGEIFSRFCIGK